jgi:hypothetical protein
VLKGHPACLVLPGILAMVVFPRHKIIIYHEFGVLLASENVDKFIAVRWVGT